jgi:hypothetical protein
LGNKKSTKGFFKMFIRDLANFLRVTHESVYNQCKIVDYNHKDCIIEFYLEVLLYLFIFPYLLIMSFYYLIRNNFFRALVHVSIFIFIAKII